MKMPEVGHIERATPMSRLGARMFSRRCPDERKFVHLRKPITAGAALSNGPSGNASANKRSRRTARRHL